jgi:hypothetical protein
MNSNLLAALRRAGAPYELNPTRLMRATLLSSSGMTRRGRSVIDRAVETHVEKEERLLAALTPAERRTLDRLLKSLLIELERAERNS